jgi:hypothetical protein
VRGPEFKRQYSKKKICGGALEFCEMSRNYITLYDFAIDDRKHDFFFFLLIIIISSECPVSR